MSGPVSIYFLTKKCPDTVRRGGLNLNILWMSTVVEVNIKIPIPAKSICNIIDSTVNSTWMIILTQVLFKSLHRQTL